MLLFSPDPSHEDIKDFMDDAERDVWDNQKGTAAERGETWRLQEELWRSIPDPTDQQLRQVMRNEDWQGIREHGDRGGVLTYYRRKWKKDRKAEAIARRVAEQARQPEPPIVGPEPTTLPKPEDDKPKQPELLTEPPPTEPKQFDGVYQEFDPSQASPLLGEFATDPETGKTVIRVHRGSVDGTKTDYGRPARILNHFRVFRWIGTHPKTRIGSGLAMAGTALGTELSSAPKLAAVFYAISWVIWGLVIYFSGLWKKSRALSVAIIGFLGIGLFVFWYDLLPEHQPTPEEYAAAVWKRAPAPEPKDATEGGFIQIVDREFLRAGSIDRYDHINLKFQAKGNKTIVGLVHNHMLVDSERELNRNEIERLIGAGTHAQYKKENEVYELQPDARAFNTYPDMGDATLSQYLPKVESGKLRVYSFVVYKYRYKGMPNGVVRVTENCAWITGNWRVLEWVTCWNRVYDIPQP